MDAATDIEKILNLKTNDSIGVELADRQLRVIQKGYEFLSEPENNVLYIADEVGLGKTYVAAGIMTLLRHYSSNREEHKDLIIVPKKNLQFKWFRELRSFTEINYQEKNSPFQRYYDHEANVINERLYKIQHDRPISIFRMTSFSSVAAYRQRPTELRASLIHDVFKNDSFAEEVVLKAYQIGWFKKDKVRELKHLVAYLLNAVSPKINTLVVDEAHNYKKGYGSSGHYESIRNECTARFLGTLMEDDAVFEQFPELKARVKFPLAEKIICLSATPKDESLLEIKNQFNCLSAQHLLSSCRTEGDVAEKLNYFLIRGNLEYHVNGEMVSRNKCIHEHRKGNVKCEENADFLELEDNFESVFWQLLQYKTIKHLDKEYSASFEIGMLSGFETYNTSLRNRFVHGSELYESDESSSKEYDIVVSRDKHKSQDLDVVSDLISSYQKEFDEPPPHPKQTRLVKELHCQIAKQQKSLVFARRVLTVDELSSRLLSNYEKEIVIEKQLMPLSKIAKINSPELENLIKSYQDRAVFANIYEIGDRLVWKSSVREFLKDYELPRNERIQWFAFAYNEFRSDENNYFAQEVKRFFTYELTNASNQFQASIIDALKQCEQDFLESSSGGTVIDEDTKYFFVDYFKKGGPENYRYRPKLRRETWFDLNPVHLLKEFGNKSFVLKSFTPNEKDTDGKKTDTKRKRFTNALVLLQRGISNNTLNINYPVELDNTTHITQFLIENCDAELKEWFDKKNGLPLLHLANDFVVLSRIILNIFRNGSGLLVGFIADKAPTNFLKGLEILLTEPNAPFSHVLSEIKIIINDFDLITQQNFTENNISDTLKKIDAVYKGLAPVYGTTGKDKIDKSLVAAKFRLPGFPYTLITTDIFREGEDLHTYCQNIYHYGIAWNPSDMMQRTGRVDRINSMSYRKIKSTKNLDFENKVQVFYPYIKDSIEVNQVVKLLRKVNQFIQTFNDLEADNQVRGSEIALNEEVLLGDIPPQFTDRVKSKYDIDEFKG